eukprot:6211225-Pleurochrysis_carterae.AAC.4
MCGSCRRRLHSVRSKAYTCKSPLFCCRHAHFTLQHLCCLTRASPHSAHAKSGASLGRRPKTRSPAANCGLVEG